MPAGRSGPLTIPGPGVQGRGAVGVAGHRCPIVGRVSMDLTAVDVGGLVFCAGQVGLDPATGAAVRERALPG